MSFCKKYRINDLWFLILLALSVTGTSTQSLAATDTCKLLASHKYEPGNAGFGTEMQKINASKAFAACKTVAMRSDAKAADMFRFGRVFGAKKEMASAVKWYQKSAEKEYAPAYYNLGWSYHFGQGVKRDYKLAMQYYTKATNQGYYLAYTAKGNLYYGGLGVKKNIGIATLMYIFAANKGEPIAQNQLGVIFYDKKKYTNAHKWFIKAANQNYANGQANVGLLYHYGNGVPKNSIKARYWYNKAASQGQKMAKKNLVLLNSQLFSTPQKTVRTPTKSDDNYNKIVDHLLGFFAKQVINEYKKNTPAKINKNKPTPNAMWCQTTRERSFGKIGLDPGKDVTRCIGNDGYWFTVNMFNSCKGVHGWCK